MGLRRHVPHSATGRASSARAARACSPSPRPSSCTGCCSYGAHFTEQGRPPARREDGRAAHRRAVAVPQGVAKKRGGPIKVNRRAATPSPGWSTAPASSSTAPTSPAAPGCALHRPRSRPASAPSTGSPRSAGSSRSAASTSTDDVRPRHLDAARVEAPRLGRGRLRVPLVVHRRPRRRSSASTPGLPWSCATRSSSWSAASPTA